MNVNRRVAVLVENASTIKYLKLNQSVNGCEYRVYMHLAVLIENVGTIRRQRSTIMYMSVVERGYTTSGTHRNTLHRYFPCIPPICILAKCGDAGCGCDNE